METITTYGVGPDQPTYNQLREQNRVLREALRQALDDIPGWVMLASDVLTATSQPAPPYKEWCRHPEECAGLASCPRNPTCAD